LCKKHQARDENIIKSKVKLVKDTIKPTGVLEREQPYQVRRTNEEKGD
jgi:hypothetical protein